MSRRSLLVFWLSIVGALGVSGAHAQEDSRYGGRPGYGGPAYGGEVECRSTGYGYQRCPVPWRDAQLVQQ
jgi:hypothetical protein